MLYTQAQAIALDSSRNIYVVDGYSSPERGYVTVYRPRANGNVAPIDKIRGSLTMIKYPSSIALDSSNSIYVANGCREKLITVYAAGADGNVVPINTIEGPGISGSYRIRILPL